MKLPKKLQVRSITPSSVKVYLFKDKPYNPYEPSNPHYHICLPISDDQYILLVMMTKSVKKIKDRYKSLGSKLLNSLIFLDKDSKIDVVKYKTVIDCNRPKYKTHEELTESLIGDITTINCKISEDIIAEIIDAILDSPMVKPEIKKTLIIM